MSTTSGICTSTILNFFNIFDKLKFKKKSKCKKSALLESGLEKNETKNKNETILHNKNNNNGIPTKSDNKKDLKANIENCDNVLKDMLIKKTENYVDIEKVIINNNTQEEGQTAGELLPNKTVEKENNVADVECIVLHQKKHKLKKKEKFDDNERSPKERQVNVNTVHSENLGKEPVLNTCGIDGDNDNNNNNDNNNINNLFGYYNDDIGTEKCEMKKHKNKNKHLRCEYIVENCNVVELNKGMINDLRTFPINFNENQLLFMEGKHIKKVSDHNNAVNKNNTTLKLKKCKASYIEKPLNNKCSNSQSKCVKALRNENTTFNISKSLIITNSGAEIQKRRIHNLPILSESNIKTLRESIRSKKKKRRKTQNIYHALAKPRSNLIIVENNMDDKDILKSKGNSLLFETTEERHVKETSYLDSIPVRDSKDSSIDEYDIDLKNKSFTLSPRNNSNNEFLDKCIYKKYPNFRTFLGKKFDSKYDVHASRVTHGERAPKERFTNIAEKKIIDIEVNFDDKPNECYNFLVENKNHYSSTKYVEVNNKHSKRNNVNLIKTTTSKNKMINKPFEEESRHSTKLPHSLEVKKALNEYNHEMPKKMKSKSYNKPTLKHVDHICKQKRLPYTLVKKPFIPDMEHKEYISVANIRAPLKLRSGTLNEMLIQPETKFKTNSGQHSNEAKANLQLKQNKLEEYNQKKFNFLHPHINFPGDCFVDKNMQTNDEGLIYGFKKNIENIKKGEKGDYVSDESDMLVNQFNMFLKIMKNLNDGNAESVKSVINDADFLSKYLKVLKSENYSACSRDKFIRVIESTEIENWESEKESRAKHADPLQKSSKFISSKDDNKLNRDYFVRVVESDEIKNMKTGCTESERNPVHSDSTSNLYTFLNDKYSRITNRNNFVRIVKSSEYCNINNTENGIRHYSNDFFINSCLKNNNKNVSIPSRERILIDSFHDQNKTSSVRSHPKLSVNFVNVSKNRRVNFDAATDKLRHNEEYKPQTVKYDGETQSISKNDILNRKAFNEKHSHYIQHFSDLDYKHKKSCVHSDSNSIKGNMNSHENEISCTNNNFSHYQPKACGEVMEDVLTNRKFINIYAVKPGNSDKNLLKENEQKINVMRQTKFNNLCSNLQDFKPQQNKYIWNISSVSIKNVCKSLSDSNLSNRSLSTEKVILKDNDFNGLTFYKTKFKEQQKVIIKDMGINTDTCTAESEYLFSKCILLLVKHLIKFYESCNKKTCSDSESCNELNDDNNNFKRVENTSGYDLYKDKDCSSIKPSCNQHYKDEHCKVSEEIYTLLCQMLSNNLNIPEVSGKNEAFLKNLQNMVCQNIEKNFKELNKSIAELSKKISEAVVKKHSNESVSTLNLKNDTKDIKHSEIKNQSLRSEDGVQQKTSEILELMKIIENSDISSSGCTDSGFVENKNYSRICETSTNKNSMESKSVVRFQIEVQLNDTMELDKVVVEGS